MTVTDKEYVPEGDNYVTFRSALESVYTRLYVIDNEYFWFSTKYTPAEMAQKVMRLLYTGKVFINVKRTGEDDKIFIEIRGVNAACRACNIGYTYGAILKFIRGSEYESISNTERNKVFLR